MNGWVALLSGQDGAEFDEISLSALGAFSHAANIEKLIDAAVAGMHGHHAESIDVRPLAGAIALLAVAGPKGLLDFERAWRGALLVGAPVSLASYGLYAWVLECGRQLRANAPALNPVEIAILKAHGRLAFMAAGIAADIATQVVRPGGIFSEEGGDSAVVGVLQSILDNCPDGKETGLVVFSAQDPLGRGPLGAEGDSPWLPEALQLACGRLRADDRLLMLSANEWVLIAPRLVSLAQLPLAARAISVACSDVLRRRFGAEETLVRAGAAAGPVHAPTAPTLIAAARSALVRARNSHESFCLFEPAMAHDGESAELGIEFSRALVNNELQLFFQPQMRLLDRRCVAVEALLRWQRESGEWVAPPRMIAMAERLGLLPKLCSWLIAEACRVSAALAHEGWSLRVAINITASDLYDADLPEQVLQLARTWGVTPDFLVIEVTETLLIANPKRARRVLSALQGLGCRISLDDFGTGYSSLAYLRELPVDEIKVDRSFVLHALGNERDAAIVRSVIALGRGLGLNVVAEGAEDGATIEWLRRENCVVVQGYGLAKPMPYDDLLAWLAARRAAGDQ